MTPRQSCLHYLPVRWLRLLPHLLLAALVMLLPLRVEAETMHIHVIELKQRSAAEAIPLVKPFLAPGGAISGTGYKLIVRTTDENFASIQQMLAEIDTAPRQLMVTVRQGSQSRSTAQGIGIHGNVRSDNGKLSVNGRSEIYSTETHESVPGEQRLRVLEGQWATIQFGQSIPIVQRSYRADGSVSESVQYKAVTSGFDVLARVHGDEVTLFIRPSKAAPSPAGGGVINEQQAETTVRGRLGEWIDLGGISEVRDEQGSGIVYRTESHSLQTGNISVRVDAVTP